MAENNQLPVFSLNAVLHKDLATETKVFSIHDMEYYLWVKVAPDTAKYYKFYELDEVDLKKVYDLNVADFCVHEPGRVWFKFNSMLLNRKAGTHVYKMHFVNTQNETTISLYFAYTVQREDVDKPYIYMPDKVQEMQKRMKI